MPNSMNVLKQPSAKLRSPMTRRLTIGFLAVSSQPIAPSRPTAEAMAMPTMKLEPNQSSSSPRSITTCRQPSPNAIRPSPIASMLRLGWLATQGGSSTRAVTAKKVNMPRRGC